MCLKYWRIYTSCLTTFLSTLCNGLIQTYPSPAFPDLNSGHYGFKLSTDMMTWLASFSNLFAVFGALWGVLFIDRYGRKFVFVMGTVISTVGWFLSVASPNVTTMAVGRSATGFALGVIMSTWSIYASEISVKEMRGRVSTLATNCFLFGGVCMNLLGAFVNWRWLAVVGLATTTLAALSTFFMYETPRWLVSKGHRLAAAEVINKLWHIENPVEIEKEIQVIEDNMKLVPKVGFFEGLAQLVKPPLWKPLVITQLLIVFQIFTGYSFIMNYAVNIFKETSANFNTTNELLSNPNYQSCLVSVANMLGCTVSMLLIDRVGRRVLLIISGCIITVTLTAMGIYYYMQLADPLMVGRYLNWMPLTCLICNAIGFCLAYSGIPFLLVCELFPLHIRGVAVALGAICNNLVGFIVVKGFGMLTFIPNYDIFWIYAGVTLISVVYVIFFIPETKGRSLEEIQLRWYPSNQSSRLSPSGRPSLFNMSLEI